MCHYLSIIIVALLSVTVQAADPVASDSDRLKESLAKWEKAREEHRGNYSYQVTKVFFIGTRNTTTIVVRGNKVIERSFVEFGEPVPVKPGEALPESKPKWVETGKDLGTHKDEGAPARSVDEFYAEAAKLLEQPVPEHHKRYVAFDKQGLLSHCFLVDPRILDDTPLTGIAPFQIQLEPRK